MATSSGASPAPMGTTSPTFTNAAAALPSPAVPDEKMSFLFHVHQYLREEIKFADQKAAFLFAFAVGLATLGYNLHLYDLIAGRLAWTWESAPAICALGFIFGSAGLSLATLLPRLWSDGGTGVVYFGHISHTGSPASYTSTVASLDDATMCVALSDHCYTLATIAERKFRYSKWAVWMGGIGVFLTLLAFVIKTSAATNRTVRQQLMTIDRASTSVLVALDLNLPIGETSLRTAALGTEIESLDMSELSGDQRRLEEMFKKGYIAAVDLNKILSESALHGNARRNDATRHVGQDQAIADARHNTEILLRNAHKRLEEYERSE